MLQPLDSSNYDLIVIGGGPGGSTLATLVAMQGHRVLLLERERFPRYQIGESLLPSTLSICAKTGVLDKIDNAGFMRKSGGAWYWGTAGKPGWGFDFAELPSAPVVGKARGYQVERAKFDEILLNHAMEKGVDVRQGCSVQDIVEKDGRFSEVRYLDDATGQQQSASARFIADAGGHKSRFHRLCGERVYPEQFRNVALFCYYRGGKRMPAPNSGNILNVTFDKGWFWYIPLRDDLTSLGAVLPVEHAHLLQGGHEAAMNSMIDSCPLIKDFLGDTPRVTDGVYGEYRVRRDWSYANTSFWKPGLVLVGDAACFVDPLFSSGVHLTTHAALLASRSINTVLRGTLSEEECFQEYTTRYSMEYFNFLSFLTDFYDINKDKEEYFSIARKIIGTEETDRQAFVRLVSGFSPLAPDHFNQERRQRLGDMTGSDNQLVARPAPTVTDSGSGIVPSEDGLFWTRAPTAA